MVGLVLLVAVVALAVVHAVDGVGSGGRDAVRASDPPPSSADSRTTAPPAHQRTPQADPRLDSRLDPRWTQVLTALLDRRATAWRDGEPDGLTAVYLRGSAALARDEAMLRSYLARGLRVSGVRTRCAVVTLERQLPDRATLVVVDSLGAAVARDARGVVLPLPRDLPTRHRIRLVMTPGGWRIAGITQA